LHFEIHPEPGRSLADRLFELGVEFPCGGESACGGCKIRVLSGHIPITATMRQALSEADLAQGWRLACCAESRESVVVEVDQWSLPVLTDEQSTPLETRDGLGAAIDLGTTTLVAQMVDLSTGEVLAVETALNPQARHGADVMSRIQYDLRHPGELTTLIREILGRMLARLAGDRPLEEVLIAGNTAMHHLFCGLSVEPLAAVPFLSAELGERRFSARELGWARARTAVEVRSNVRFLPCLGGFVGSDLLAGMVATRLAVCDSRVVRHRHQWRDCAGQPTRNPVRFHSRGTCLRRRTDQRGDDRQGRRYRRGARPPWHVRMPCYRWPGGARHLRQRPGGRRCLRPWTGTDSGQWPPRRRR